jgi:hypothetical protein
MGQEKRDSMRKITNTTTPGIHPNFSMDRFSLEERTALQNLSREWYLTNSGGNFGPTIQIGAAEYKYFLMKPTLNFSEMFNVEREILCVFSPYSRLEPRTLDAFAGARARFQELRLESVCYVLISKDDKAESIIENLLKTDPEQPIVIPFTYSEISGKYDYYFVRNRFRKHFYSRDLFSFLSPLKKDLYFFGRSQLLHEIVNRHRSGEHTGLFGLRKSGKTSIVYAVERMLEVSGETFVSVDCESPSIHKLRWNELLHKMVALYNAQKGSNMKLLEVDSYTEKSAADVFSEEMLKVFSSQKRKSTLFIFDEIERISPNTGSSEHWRNEDDFIYFWQTLRGFFQRNSGVLTYMIVGTNPISVEKAIIGRHENPLFGSIPSQYVPSFTLDQVREMVEKLGLYMGLRFDDLVIAKMTEDFGGHPFLIRHLCSATNKTATGDRPKLIDKSIYQKCKSEFLSNSGEYLEMIVQVLQEWYPDEYEMLQYLSNGDKEAFTKFAADNAQYTQHLIGYGLINSGSEGFTFNIEAIKEFISKKHKFEKLNLSYEEKLQEITTRRNLLERNIRVISKNTLKIAHGKKAGQVVLSAVPEERRKSIGTEDIEVLLNKDKSQLYFLDLINLIGREWVVFQNVFEVDKDKLTLMLKEINSSGRPDAHGKSISEDDFTQLRLYFKKLETTLAAWVS